MEGGSGTISQLAVPELAPHGPLRNYLCPTLHWLSLRPPHVTPPALLSWPQQINSVAFLVASLFEFLSGQFLSHGLLYILERETGLVFFLRLRLRVSTAESPDLSSVCKAAGVREEVCVEARVGAGRLGLPELFSKA